jgi:serine/threonine-protein kinase
VAVWPAQDEREDEFALGATFAGYRIAGVVASGATGVLYRATRDALAWPIALKLIGAPLAEDDAFRDRFERASRLATSLRHPNPVHVHDFGERDGRLFLATRHVAGTDLGTLVARDGAIGVERAARLIGQVASALDATHRRGLIHRDVKPAHMLVAGELHERAVLTDVGLSGLGALECLAPELVDPAQAGVRSDMYALGCVLFYALAGRAPLARDTHLATIVAHLSEPPSALRAWRPNAPAALEEVIARALSKDPGDRPESAGAFAAAVDEAIRPHAAPVAPRSPRRRARRLRFGVAVATAVAAAGAVVVSLGDGGDTDRHRVAAPPPAVPAPAPHAPRTVATIHIGKAADGIAAAGEDVWVAALRDNELVRIDARSNRVTARVPAGTDPDSVAAARRAVWVSSRATGRLLLFRARPRPVQVRALPVGAKPEGAGLSGRRAWVVSAADDTVTRASRDSGAVSGTPTPVGGQPIDVSVGPSGVWTTNSDDGTVTHVDTATGWRVGGPIRVGRAPKGVTEGFGSVWVANGGDDTVSRLDAGTGRAIGRPIHVGDQPSKLTVAAGLVWVTNFGSATVTRIDPRAGRVVGAPLRVGRHPVGIAFGAGHVWVASLGDGTVTKIRP